MDIWVVTRGKRVLGVDRSVARAKDMASSELGVVEFSNLTQDVVAISSTNDKGSAIIGYVRRFDLLENCHA